MGVFVGIVAACLTAVGAVGGAWLKQRKERAGGRVVAGLVFIARGGAAVLALIAALSGFAVLVGWQAVGAAAFVGMTPLLLASAVLAEGRGRAA